MRFYSEKFAADEGKCWFIEGSPAKICEVDCEKKYIDLVDLIGGLDIKCQDILYYRGKLIIVPESVLQIYVIDLESGQKEIIELEKRKPEFSDYFLKFMSAMALDDYIYIIPYAYPALVKINMHIYEVEYIDSFVKEMEQLEQDVRSGMFTEGIWVNKELCIPIRRPNGLFFFDTETKEYEIVLIGDADKRYTSVFFDGKYYWLAAMDGTIYKWVRDMNKVVATYSYEASNIVKSSQGCYDNNSHIVCVCNQIWIISNVYPICVVDEKQGTLVIPEAIGDVVYYNNVCTRVVGERIYIHSKVQELLSVIDLKNNDVEEIALRLDGKVEKKALQLFIAKVKNS